MESDWTQFESAKLIVGVATPAAVAFLGWHVSRVARKVEAAQWANRTVIEKRLQLFTNTAPKLNLLLCFFSFVGTWKEISPAAVIATKRALDEIMYTNRIIFSPATFDAYHALMRKMFAMYARADGDALIRSEIESGLGSRRKMPWWTDESAEMFASNGNPSIEEIWKAYELLNDAFRRDLYVTRPEILRRL